MYKYSSIGEKIRNFRKRAGVSQTDLELEIGASFGSLSRIENGQTNPTKETLMKISKALHLREDEITYLFHIRDLEITEKDIQNIVDKSNEMFKDIKVPAYVYDYRWRIWNWNDQVLKLFHLTPEFAMQNRGISIMELIFNDDYGVNKYFSQKYRESFIYQQITKFQWTQKVYNDEPWLITLMDKLKTCKGFDDCLNMQHKDNISENVYGRGFLYMYYKKSTDAIFSINQSYFYSDPRFYLVEYYPTNRESMMFLEQDLYS